jgi:hypothetical protein
MIQVKKIDVSLGYSEDKKIDDLINDWLKNTTGIKVIDIKYNVTDSGYESALIIYDKI